MLIVDDVHRVEAETIVGIFLLHLYLFLGFVDNDSILIFLLN